MELPAKSRFPWGAGYVVEVRDLFRCRWAVLVELAVLDVTTGHEAHVWRAASTPGEEGWALLPPMGGRLNHPEVLRWLDTLVDLLPEEDSK